ncbi:MAG: hypothetical protein R3A47_08385 [Polyangiales bacterium]
MSGRFEPQIERLEERLRGGIGGTEAEQVRTELGVSDDADDRDVARALVRVLATCDTASIGRRLDSLRPSHADAASGENVHTDSSFLGRLSEFEAAELSIARIEDIATLVAIVRGGSLRQRRAALNRLSSKLRDRRSLKADEQQLALSTVLELRDVQIAYELDKARQDLPGGTARKGRVRPAEWQEVVHRTQQAIVAFWNGEIHREPISMLPGEERAMLILRARDLPRPLVDHLSAIVEGNDGMSSLEDRIGLVASLRYAGDPSGARADSCAS